MQRQSPSGPLEVQSLRFSIDAASAAGAGAYLVAANQPVPAPLTAPVLVATANSPAIAGVRMPRGGAVVAINVRHRTPGGAATTNSYTVLKADAATMASLTTIGEVVMANNAPLTGGTVGTSAQNPRSAVFGKVNATPVTPSVSPAVFVANDLLLVRLVPGAGANALNIDVVLDYVENQD